MLVIELSLTEHMYVYKVTLLPQLYIRLGASYYIITNLNSIFICDTPANISLARFD